MNVAQPLTLRELSDLLPRLQATVATLVGAATASGDKKQRKRRRTSAPRLARKPASMADVSARLLDALKRYRKNGAGLAELAKAIGAERTSVAYHLRVLREGKQARVIGERGQARWFAA